MKKLPKWRMLSLKFWAGDFSLSVARLRGIFLKDATGAVMDFWALKQPNYPPGYNRRAFYDFSDKRQWK